MCFVCPLADELVLHSVCGRYLSYSVAGGIAEDTRVGAVSAEHEGNPEGFERCKAHKHGLSTVDCLVSRVCLRSRRPQRSPILRAHLRAVDRPRVVKSGKAGSAITAASPLGRCAM